MSTQFSQLIPSTAPLAALDETDVGGKAWNLYRLRAFGFRVPGWYVVPGRHFGAALGDRIEAISAIVRRIDFADRSAIEATASEIREIVLRTDLPVGLREELARIFDDVDDPVWVAVRSSISGEDSADNSFAGQMDTVLNVALADVPASVQEVWASAYSARALLYRHHRGLDLAAITPAVVVQRMLTSDVAGVMFTRDPETAGDACVISSAHGLCEGVTSDVVETDTYRCNSAGEIEKRIAEKNARVVSSRRGGIDTVPVPENLRHAPVLSDHQITELYEVGRRLEEIFGAPQDVEWSFDAGGRCWLLQTRPIVFANGATTGGHLGVWDNSNIVESYPGITLPLTFSFARKAYETSFRSYIRSFFPFGRSFVDGLPVFKYMLGLIDGRVYYNLPNWYAMLSMLPHAKGHKAAWDQMVGVEQRAASRKLRVSAFDRLCASVLMAIKLFAVKRTARRFFACFDRTYRCHAETDLSAADEFALIDIYEDVERELSGAWRLTLDNDFCAMTYYAGIKALCRCWGPSDRADLHHDLMRGQTSIESLAPVQSLVRLAHLFRSDPRSIALLDEPDDGVIWRRIQREVDCAPLRAALDEHLKAFGDRILEELKLETPSLRDRPEDLIGLVKRHDALRAARLKLGDRGSGVSHDASRVLRERLRNPIKRWVILATLRNARIAIANRENMRFARSRLFGLARRIFRRMGEAFAARGVLDSAADIHLLTVDEIFDYVRGTAVTQDLKRLVALRTADYERFAERRPPDRVQTTGLPYLTSCHDIEIDIPDGNSASGIGCGSGSADGIACVVHDARDAGPTEGRILVARSTDPGWIFLMTSAKGIVVEKGSVLSHTAIVGRELGIPTVVGIKDATRRIADGARIFIDGSTGEVRWSETPATNRDRPKRAA